MHSVSLSSWHPNTPCPAHFVLCLWGWLMESRGTLCWMATVVTKSCRLCTPRSSHMMFTSLQQQQPLHHRPGQVSLELHLFPIGSPPFLTLGWDKTQVFLTAADRLMNCSMQRYHTYEILFLKAKIAVWLLTECGTQTFSLLFSYLLVSELKKGQKI